MKRLSSTRVMLLWILVVGSMCVSNCQELHSSGSLPTTSEGDLSAGSSILPHEVPWSTPDWWQHRRLEESLSVDVTFESILKTVVFLLTAWIFARLSQMVGLPSLVGEIVTGFVLGPPLLDFVPYPEAMVLIGSFGLIGLILDSGINLDIAQLKETGSRAVMMAVTGTVLAMGAGLGMGRLASSKDFRSSMAIGAAFAPSSLGVASQVLAKGGVLNTPTGQLIVAASVVDDIFGLILLSIMEVLVQDSPKVMDFLIPFISSFGYLIVLGYVGIKWIPYLVQDKILPRFSEEKRDVIAFAMLFFLVAIYLPVLNYSGASYLTGAFLAGLSFSQIHSVCATYAKSSREISVWLMRIFFAATIGFQVPVTYFVNGDVVNWGILYMVPVLAKIPLGLMVPRIQREIPENFPYDPYWRDVAISTLAMLCRGEFNFIVASFALSAGVLEPEQYAAVVFAILLSAIIAPLTLSYVIQYYNKKFTKFFQANNTIKRIGNTSDGTRPLFLAIQARTPVNWGLQDKFKHALEKSGISIIDHRLWHTLGLEAVNVTEIFCQDTQVRLRLRAAFPDMSPSLRTVGSSEDDDDIDKSLDGSHHEIQRIKECPSKENLAEMEDLQEQEEDRDELRQIELRKEEIRQVLVDCLDVQDSSEYVIQVSQWETFVFEDRPEETEDIEAPDTGYRFVTPAASGESVFDEPAENDEGLQNRAPQPTSRGRSVSYGNTSDFIGTTADAPNLDFDLWDVDDITHDLTREGFFMSPAGENGQVVMEGCIGEVGDRATPGHRRVQSFDPSILQAINRDVEATTIKERLHGYVRP